MQRRDTSVASPVNFCVAMRVEAFAALLVRGGHAEDVRPERPRVVAAAAVGRPRQELELVDARRALPMGGAEAVGARVAAADDDDVACPSR